MPNHQEHRLHEQRIMVVDDDRYLLMAIDQTLSLNGYAVDTFSSPVEALEMLNKKEYAAVVTDIKMPVMDGLQFLNHVKAADRELPVIMITGHGDIALAVTAIQGGAYDFLQKPVDEDVLLACLVRAMEKRRLVLENRRLSLSLAEQRQDLTRFYGLIGNHPAMHRLYDIIKAVAAESDPVLICGETGTGKELVARAIHEIGSRADHPFVAVNMGATAIGTGLNAPEGYAERCAAHLAELTGKPIVPASDMIAATWDQQGYVVYSGALKSLAVTLSKNARARAVQLPAWNEALGLPRPWDQQWSLRMQQILGFHGLERIEVQEATAGDIICFSGIDLLNISDTLCDPVNVVALGMFDKNEIAPSTFAVHGCAYSAGYASASYIINKLGLKKVAFFGPAYAFGTDQWRGAQDAFAKAGLNPETAPRTWQEIQNAAGAFDDITLGNVLVFAEDDGADRVALQIQGHAHGVAGELQHFTLHDIGQAVDTDDAVGDGNHRPLGTELGARFQVLDFALDQLADFRRIQLHRNSKILESSF